MKSSYFSIQSSLFEDKGFKSVSASAKIVFMALKSSLPVSNIDKVYGLEEKLAEMCGIDEEGAGEAIQELVEAGFCKYQDKVIWIVRGLEHNPSYSVNHKNINSSVRNQVNVLKDHPLACEFRARYAYIFGNTTPAATVSEGLGKGFQKDQPQPICEGSYSCSCGCNSVVKEKKQNNSSKKEKAAKKDKGQIREDQKVWAAKAYGLWSQHCGPLSRSGAVMLVKALDAAVSEYGADRVLNTLEHYVIHTPSRFISSLGNMEYNFSAKFLSHEAKALGKEQERATNAQQDRELQALVADCIIEEGN